MHSYGTTELHGGRLCALLLHEGYRFCDTTESSVGDGRPSSVCGSGFAGCAYAGRLKPKRPRPETLHPAFLQVLMPNTNQKPTAKTNRPGSSALYEKFARVCVCVRGR